MFDVAKSQTRRYNNNLLLRNIGLQKQFGGIENLLATVKKSFNKMLPAGTLAFFFNLQFYQQSLFQ